MADSPYLAYRVRFAQPETHVYDLTLRLTGLEDRAFTLSMPVWAPGHYVVADYSRHVFDFAARREDGSPLAWRKVRKDAWQVDAPGADGRAVVTYRVYAHELSVSASHLTQDHAYWNGTSMFMALDDRHDLGAEVSIEVPDGWRISSGLPAKAGDSTTLVADSYDLLMDSPVEVSAHRVQRFEALGRRHEIAIFGYGNEDLERLTADVKRVVEAQAAIFGGLPYERYVFLLHLTDGTWGGLEHLYSTTCDVDRFSFVPESRYRRVMGLLAHEFFHLWNVKRIRPASLGPFDYGRENYTTLLWAMEGLTDYYGQLSLFRAGILDRDAYLKELAERICDYERTPGRAVQSASEASFDTWVKFYRPDEDSINRTISYYLKGELLGVGLELTLRRLTGAARGLDDVMRLLWQEYGSRGRGMVDGAWREAAERVAGHSLADFFDRYVDGTAPYNLEDQLAQAGLRITRRHSAADPDSEPADAPKDADHPPTAWLGLHTRAREGRLLVREVLRDGPSARSGIAPGDELLAVDGYRVDDRTLAERLKRIPPEREVTLDYVQDGALRRTTVRAGATPPDRYRIVSAPSATDLERAVHRAWLGEDWQPPKEG